jgi:hypothetical protein
MQFPKFKVNLSGTERLAGGMTSAVRAPQKIYQSKIGMRFDQLKNRLKGVKRTPSLNQRTSGFGSKISRSTNDGVLKQQRVDKLQSRMNATAPTMPSTGRMTRTRSSAMKPPTPSPNKFLGSSTRITRTRTSAFPTTQRAVGTGINNLKPKY